MAGAIDLFSGSTSLTGTNLFGLDKNPLNQLDEGIEDVIGQQAIGAANHIASMIEGGFARILGVAAAELEIIGTTVGDAIEHYFGNILTFLGEIDPLSPTFDPLAAIENFITTMLKPTNLIAMLVSDATHSAGLSGFIPLENLALDLITTAVGDVQAMIDAILAGLGFAPGSGLVTDINKLFTNIYNFLANPPNLADLAFDVVSAVEHFITTMLHPTGLLAPLIAGLIPALHIPSLGSDWAGLIDNSRLTAILGGTSLGADLGAVATTLFGAYTTATHILSSAIANVLGRANLGADLSAIGTLLFGSSTVGPHVLSSAIANILGQSDLGADLGAVATTLFGAHTTASHILNTSVANILGGADLGADVRAIVSQGIAALGGSTATLSDWNAFLQKIPAINLHAQINPAFNGVGTAGTVTAGTATSGGTITATAGADVFALVVNNSSVAVSSVTAGGTGMTLVPSATAPLNASSANGTLSVYRLAAGATGSAQAIVATFASSTDATVFPISYTGVFAISGVTTSSGLGITGSLAMTCSAKQIILSAIGQRGTTNFSAQTGGTNRYLNGVNGAWLSVSDSSAGYTATTTQTSAAWAGLGIVLVGNGAPAIDPTIIPDITVGMSSDLTGLLNAGVNALKNTPGAIGNAITDFETELAKLPTAIHNALTGSFDVGATADDAAAALQGTKGTLDIHSQAIKALQDLAAAGGEVANIVFQAPGLWSASTSGSYTWTRPSWFTLGTDWTDGTALGSGAGGDGAGVGASSGSNGNTTTMIVSGTGGSTITGAAGVARASSSATGLSPGTQSNDDVLYTGGGANTAPGGGGNAATGFNRFGGGAGGWAIHTWKPAAAATITGTIGAGGAAGTGPGGIGAPGGAGGAWVLSRQALQSMWTVGASTRRVKIYRYNVATSLTDSQITEAIWNNTPGGTGTGHLIFIRGNTTLDTLVYLLLSYSGGTNYELGCYNAGTNHVFQTGTFAASIPSNNFGLESDAGRNYTVLINGVSQFTYSDTGGALSAAPSSSLRIGGWGSSDASPTAGQSHGSITNFAFSDAGTPNPVADITTSETTTSSSYTDLATAGPSVIVIVPSSGIIEVSMAGLITPANGQQAWMGFALSGANTQAGADAQSLSLKCPTSLGIAAGIGGRFVLTALSPGTTTVKAVYRSGSGTATFANREIAVFPH